ncbi:protachykinin-1 isoform X3 [Notamacropus eugenii]|uniref:protachykinin-1 isoform X3 n=1 Tax=Notamacropus eugenii TaxID=9315 RepID=UPI003B6767E1
MVVVVVILSELRETCSSSLVFEGTPTLPFGCQAPQTPARCPALGQDLLHLTDRTRSRSHIPNMKILVALAVLFLASAQAFADEMGANDDLNYWADWSDSDQIKEELSEPFEHFLQRIARRPKPQQFFGLMGKRDADSSVEKQVGMLKALYGKHLPNPYPTPSILLLGTHACVHIS